MKHRISNYALAFLVFLAAGTVNAEPSAQDIAESDQQRISAFVEQHYSEYVENYLKVFMGHFRCDYDFIDEARFNDLADDALESLSASVRMMLGERLQALTPSPSPGQLDYLSALVALSVIDAHAEKYTAKIDAEYEAEKLDCADAKDENRAIYDNLPTRLAALSGLVIPGQ